MRSTHAEPHTEYLNRALDWTLVRPGRLTNRPGTGNYRVTPRYRPHGGINIPRADVASFMLDQLTDTHWSRQTPTLAT